MKEYKGFTAKIWEEDGKWKGVIFGLDIRFEAETEGKCVDVFHKIVDEHMPEPD